MSAVYFMYKFIAFKVEQVNKLEKPETKNQTVKTITYYHATA